ncbi:MAG: nicotinate-nucleotide adenylyltransferase [Crocinitomicaceae bacterium]|mgnify:CR=1 FL=1|nr:nicotinate-nucleotide adenylyltransferase [Crocinitomicaceae bacterium]|tara:strand:- start:21021 stop:22433 length:1413 start_codon:yes stop_codon:yes gene_type:complete
MAGERIASTREKALKINLHRDIYGSFGEIGAGQEVANHFYRVGGASGTIAFSLSAYDMKISDFIYGESERYVCEPRLVQMLNFEYKLITRKLAHRSDTSRFFTFSNTVEVLNYRKTNQGHGWLGLRFQLKPNTPPNDCIIHVNLNDNDQKQQQNSLGILGVNFIYACYFYSHDPKTLLKSLLDNLSRSKIEINMIRLSGPDFKHVDNRLMALRLVKYGMTEAALFGPTGDVLQPSEALYKKNALLLRGRFRPVTHVNIDMLNKGLEQYKKEKDVNEKNLKVIFELTLKDLSSDGTIRDKDFLDRVDILCSLGHTVMISNYVKYYKVIKYISTFTKKSKVGIILGISNLQTIFDTKYYDNLKGGIFEAFGVGFGNNVKMFVYPLLKEDGKELITTNEMEIDDKLRGLLSYLKDNNKIEDITNADISKMHIFSDQVLEMIKNGESGWEELVPKKVADSIVKLELFDYQAQLV